MSTNKPIKKVTYSANEIGEIFGVPACKVEQLASNNNLKTEQYGKWHNDKQSETFRYYNKAVMVLRYLIKRGGVKC